MMNRLCLPSFLQQSQPLLRRQYNRLFGQFLRFRMREIERMRRTPIALQEKVRRTILSTASSTEWGKRYALHELRTAAAFAERLPLQYYDELKPAIERMMLGEKDVLWPGRVRYFSRSSGTTSDRSKYLPVSRQNLRRCHTKGSWDAITLFYHHRPDARQFAGKTLLMGGSMAPYPAYPKTLRGDVSAFMIRYMPLIAHPFVAPDIATMLLPDFEEKLERIARALLREPDLVMIGGVPTWTVVLFRRLLELSGKAHILELLPNLQGYVHGGVSFRPYREQFARFLPSEKISYQEIYNASEGFFAVQDIPGEEGLLLLLNNGVYYEFLPPEEWHQTHPQAVPLEAVELGRTYELVITTNAGLWRYRLGDTVCFTSVKPYRIKITGRTQQFINTFGEEVMVDNTDEALAYACNLTGAQVIDYSVAPVYLGDRSRGGHEWLVEFSRPPLDAEHFALLLDEKLRAINSDYDAKRHLDMALTRLCLRPVPEGTFHRWLKAKGKFGGQHKVPRLANDRRYLEDILATL